MEEPVDSVHITTIAPPHSLHLPRFATQLEALCDQFGGDANSRKLVLTATSRNAAKEPLRRFAQKRHQSFLVLENPTLEEIVQQSSALLAFWDGKDRDIMMVVGLALLLDVPVTLVRC